MRRTSSRIKSEQRVSRCHFDASRLNRFPTLRTPFCALTQVIFALRTFALSQHFLSSPRFQSPPQRNSRQNQKHQRHQPVRQCHCPCHPIRAIIFPSRVQNEVSNGDDACVKATRFTATIGTLINKREACNCLNTDVKTRTTSFPAGRVHCLCRSDTAPSSPRIKNQPRLETAKVSRSSPSSRFHTATVRLMLYARK
jgi:hypothetical protein